MASLVTKCTKIGRVENGAVQLHLSESQRSSIKPGVVKKLSVEEIAEQFLLFQKQGGSKRPESLGMDKPYARKEADYRLC